MRRILILAACAIVLAACNKDESTFESSVIPIERVCEFRPAPGQFINEGYDATTMEEACAYVQERLSKQQYVSLGGFGGYVVLALKEPLENRGSSGLMIRANATETSNEPAVVWVMEDTNQNNQPDEVWYELRGSESGKAETRQNYAVTYINGDPIRWVDSEGAEGEIAQNEYHEQRYFPAWLEESYTLYGTRLQSKNYDSSGEGTMWVNPPFGWGYVDNYEPSTAPYTAHAISNAMDSKGNAVHLKSVRFVKIQCAIHATSGWLGETSTELNDLYGYQDL